MQLRLVLLCPLLLAAVIRAAPPVQISELAAAGRQGLLDADGDTPDWVEVQNTSEAVVDLNGWMLSEESRRRRTWTFPATNVAPGQFVVVFASGKDRRVPGQPLHSNFKLPAEGGVLVLRSPAGEESRVERYPRQVAGVTFGLPGRASDNGARHVLIGPEADLRFLIAADGRAGSNWIRSGYDDARWRRGRNGIGFESRGLFRDLIRTDVKQAMANQALGLYLRYRFVVTNAAATTDLVLHAQYDDGYVAWLNGAEISRGNAPDRASWNSPAAGTRSDDNARRPEEVTLANPSRLLVEGTNYLAVHVLNANVQSSDLLFRVILDRSVPNPVTELPASRACSFLSKATPGAPNGAAASPGPSIQLAPRNSAQPASDELITVKATVTPLEAAVATVRLRYRVMFDDEIELPMFDDGQHGDDAHGDGLYAAAIPAKAAKPGQVLRWCVVAEDAAGRVSRWPLFDNRRDYSAYEGTVVNDPSVQTKLPVVHLFHGGQSRNAPGRGGGGMLLFFEGELYDNVALTHHGQISRGFPKPSYNVAFPTDHPFRWKTNQARVKKIKLLGNYADKSKIRNTLAYEMIAASGSIGHFAFPVRVQQNGRFHSIAEIVEHGDERWLERVGRDPRGALYKMNDSLSGRHAEKKTRKFEPGRDLASFAAALSEERPIEARAAYAYEHLDLPQCVSYFVALTLISSDDHGHKNYYLFRDSRGSGEWALLPWDVDLSWGRNWTGQYFNETIFVDNPLDLYRNGRSKPRNRLYNLFFEYPDFRQMYLRRLRTVMDELLQRPGTPPDALIIERRVRELMDQLDPPGVKRSDADLDDAGGSQWGEPSSMRTEAGKIISEYLPGRRKFLFASSRAKLFGDAIPAAQPTDVTLALTAPDPRAPEADQFARVTNPNKYAVDLSGWQIKGAGIEHQFRPGTVLPAGKTLHVTADVVQFRKSPAAREGNPPGFAQGNWKGRFRGDGQLQLLHKDGRVVAVTGGAGQTSGRPEGTPRQ